MTSYWPLRYTAPNGDHVIAVAFGEQQGCTLYCIEVVRDGDVVEQINRVVGSGALTMMAARRGWKETK